MSMRNLLRMIPYILNINNDYYTNVKKKEGKNYDGIYLNDGQKRELRRYLFTIKSDWIKGVKNFEEEYIKENGKSIEEQIKELYKKEKYIRLVKQDEEDNKKLKKGEKRKK